MENHFKFTESQRLKLLDELEKLIDEKLKNHNKEERRIEETRLQGKFGGFIERLELEADQLYQLGRQQYKPEQLCAFIADLIHSCFYIKVTPTRGNSYSEIIETCLIATEAIVDSPSNNMYRYAVAGIDLAFPRQRAENNPSLVTDGEKQTAKTEQDNADAKKKSARLKRKLTLQKKRND